MGYLPVLWRDFGESVAGLAGALTGLLFVAVSIKSDVPARSRSLASRAHTPVLVLIPWRAAGVTLPARAGPGPRRVPPEDRRCTRAAAR